MNISFKGINQFENYSILGSPIRQKTSQAEDFEYLSDLKNKLLMNQNDNYHFKNSPVPNVKTSDFNFSFHNGTSLFDCTRLHVTDTKTNITRIITKNDTAGMPKLTKLLKEVIENIGKLAFR